MSGFIDIHHHLIYGVDDGAQTVDTAMAMARAAAADGTRIVLGTSHRTPGIKPFDEGLYAQRLREMNARCREEQIPLTILPGAEILYTEQTARFLREGRVPTLAGTDYVLVEFMPDVRYDALCEALERILREGYLPVVAHAERYACIAGDVRRCEKLRQEPGVLIQMNCSSVIGGHGFWRDRQTRKLLTAGIIDIVASDAHHPVKRPTRMREAYRALSGLLDRETANAMMGRTRERAFWREIAAAASDGNSADDENNLNYAYEGNDEDNADNAD